MTVVDVTEQLMGEFEDRLGLPQIARVVSACRQDLQDAGAAPELLERIARQRLDALVAPASATVPSPRRPRVVQLP